ncbi:DoxX family protein [Burkholderia sp. L27(2015)]|uniref:DoxX family protein n=1 Tax=Burkholderia sp. L27(2015) TaxID=1641858 RepID=UPI00131DD53F|nr:DoxX family protein [Burkholderia sp. L27(2015)]
MRYTTLFEDRKNELLLVARILLVVLFVKFGWVKVTDFSGTVAYMAKTGAPLPMLAAIIAVVMEVAVAIAIGVGFYARPLAIVLAIYTLGTSMIAHHYWNMTGMAEYTNMVNFYKNLSIIGGFLLLSVTGPGKYSLDRK